MGVCRYCGQSAGWFRSFHAECQVDHDRRSAAEAQAKKRRKDLLAELRESLLAQFLDGAGAGEMASAMDEAQKAGLLPSEERSPFLVDTWSAAADKFLEDGLLSVDEEARLDHLRGAWGLSVGELQESEAFFRVGKASVLREVMAGTPTLTRETDVPVNLARDEGVAWVFRDVEYLEDVTKREVVGGSQGVSLRVMSGVYYRVGAFKAKPVYTTSRTLVDKGLLVVTDRNLFFVGSATSKKIPFAKIISFEPFSNGIGLMRDAATAKPQIFVVGDGWFAYNLITNLAKL